MENSPDTHNGASSSNPPTSTNDNEEEMDKTNVSNKDANSKTESSSYNPSMYDDMKEEDLEKVKGDAIGDTLYSERFVLSTLLKLTKLEENLSDNEEFEKDLCNLWDMTIEKDVVKLLLEHNVLELFTGIIKTTEDKRLTEILVGIIGNMCNLPETRSELCANPDITGPILELISCLDALTLVQLMRLIHAALVFDNSGDDMKWLQHFRNCENFVQNFSYILMNSMSPSLLMNAFEALHAICAQFAVIEIMNDDDCFSEIFVKPCLVAGVIEAFKTLVPDHYEQNATYDDTSVPTNDSLKIMNVFLDIHVILSQYDESMASYKPVLPELLKCISQMLSHLCQPICLLPLSYYQQGILVNINEIFLALGDPFDELCFTQIITIWNIIDSDRMEKHDEMDELDDRAEKRSTDLYMTLLEFLARIVGNCSDARLKNSLKRQCPHMINSLLNALNSNDSDPDIKDCRNRIRMMFETLYPK